MLLSLLTGWASPSAAFEFGAIVVYDIWDIAAVAGHVHKHNEELRKSLSVTPIIFPDKKGLGAGLQFSFSF